MTNEDGAPRIIEYDGFRLFGGPCVKCPPSADPWIFQFCNLPQNRWYVAIDIDWVTDWFNQYGIRELFENFDEAIELISDQHSEKWKDFTEDKIKQIHVQATRIYGLLHARWITQPKGLYSMKKKYESGVFGQCPRVLCNGTNLLPMGTSSTLRKHAVKLFCPKCCDIYKAPKTPTIDGAYFGPAFPHLFLCEFVHFDTSDEFKPFDQKVFGFRVHMTPQSKYRPHISNIQDFDLPQIEDESQVQPPQD